MPSAHDERYDFVLSSCARTAMGSTATTPTSSLVNSRRFMGSGQRIRFLVGVFNPLHEGQPQVAR